jgi:hypothetical protein
MQLTRQLQIPAARSMADRQSAVFRLAAQRCALVVIAREAG